MKRIALLLLCPLIVAAWVAGQAVPTAQTAKKKYPPRFPKADSVKLFENERVIVWDENLSTEHYMHHHVRDALWFHIHDGPVEVMEEDGKINRPAFKDVTQSGPQWGGYTKAGRPPHSERSLDPNNKRRRFVVEFKGTEPANCKEWTTDPMCK